MGRVTRSKKGRPTDTCLPEKASTSSGYIVPTRTVKAKTVSSRLLSRNTPSLLASDSSRGEDATRWTRIANRAREPTTTTPRNPRMVGPTADWVKL